MFVDRDAVSAFRTRGKQWLNRRYDADADNHHLGRNHFAARQPDT